MGWGRDRNYAESKFMLHKVNIPDFQYQRFQDQVKKIKKERMAESF